MNRLGKILTLGLAKKWAWQLRAIAALLVILGLAMHYVANRLRARQLDLVKLAEIGDIEGVQYVCEWDKGQVNREGKVSRVSTGGKKLSIWKFFPLSLAAEQGHTEMAKILLKAGAEVNAKNKWGSTPLHRAAIKGRTEVVKILL